MAKNTFCVLGTIAESTAAEVFNSLLDDLRAQFGPDRGSYFVHHEPPRAVEFACDAGEHKAVAAWLTARPEVSSVRVDPVVAPS